MGYSAVIIGSISRNFLSLMPRTINQMFGSTEGTVMFAMGDDSFREGFADSR